jgi:uncharacterized protein (DUF362 family)
MLSRRALLAAPLFASPNVVAMQRCRTYGPGLENVMRRLFDGIGGLDRLVRGKSVALKVNRSTRPNHPTTDTRHWTHPRVIGMTIELLTRAGARHVRLVEAPPQPDEVLVSLAKLKESSTTGVSLSMNNLLGLHPRPAELHADLASLPRLVAERNAARPIQLALIEGVESVAGGEGPWVGTLRSCRPGVLLAGTNALATDTVATAVMGFDPQSRRGTAPFETCDNVLELAERHGVGTRDLNRIEVAGFSVADALFPFREA